MTTRTGNPTSNMSISSTTGGDLPTTWEHPISWDSLEKYFKSALNKDTRKVFNMLLENSKSLEDHLDTAYLKTSGGTVGGASTFSGNVNISGALTLNGVSITPLSLPPTGSIMPYAGSAAPGGWLLCDGGVYSTTAYASLYAVCGSTYNTSAGQGAPSAGNFRVPILKGRMPVGLDAAITDFNTLGKTGGSTTVTITIAQMPIHSHVVPSHNHNQDPHSHTQNPHQHGINVERASANAYLDTGSYWAGGTAIDNEGYARTTFSSGVTMYQSYLTSETATNIAGVAINQATAPSYVNSEGGGNLLNVMSPYIVLNYIIKT